MKVSDTTYSLENLKSQKHLQGAEQYFSEVAFFVEADDYAQHDLWNKWYHQYNELLKNMVNNGIDETVAKKVLKDTSGIRKPFKWESINSGNSLLTGTMKVKVKGSKKEILPVYVSFRYARINGKMIIFYYCNGNCPNWALVEAFIDKHWPIKYDNGTRKARTDANNFHHVLSVIEEKEDDPNGMREFLHTDKM